MLEHINLDSNVAVYLQIENEVKFAIAAGDLKPGDQLPSILELAQKLGTNPNTVQKAYRDLEVMELVFTRRGMGVFVNRGAAATCRQHCGKRMASRLREVVAEAKAAGMTLTTVRQVVSESFASDASPYGPVPPSVSALAKKGSK